MSKVFNMVGGGGKNISSIVITGLESTDTVTCTKDGKTYPATWDDIAQHWEIVGLPLGTFTVTATNGTKTITETVLIDIAGVYEVEMSLGLWLYRNGDECEDVTGGWEKKPYGGGVGTLEKYDKYMEVNAPYSTTHLIGFVNGALSMSELRKYKTLNALYDFTTPSNTDGGACFWIGTTTTYDYSSGSIGTKVDHQKLDSYGNNVSVQDVVITTDVSNMNYGYIVVACYYGNMRIKKVWLE